METNMRSWFGKLALVAAAIGLVAATTGDALAQGQNGRGDGKQKVGISYYKTPPGRQDEWLGLYKKYHRQIMQYELDKGVILSSKVYVAGNHAPGQPWDIAIITISPAPGTAPPLGISRGELIKKLFPNIEEYVAAERQRWALTIDHWDEGLVELDINEEPFSVYYPIVAQKKAGAEKK
jgi:hypothetical protein